jgi:hypothetical protein
MKTLIAVKWWAVLPAYLVGGLVLGLADPLLGRAAQQLGFRPGLATAGATRQPTRRRCCRQAVP